jgi:hypothetical protein
MAIKPIDLLISAYDRRIRGNHGVVKQVAEDDLRLDVYASYVANPSNLDVPISSRASEATLTAIKRILENLSIANFPSEYPLPPSQVSDLKNVTVVNMPTDYAKDYKQIAVDADGHGQVDVLSMPPVSVEIVEKGFSDINNVPTRALVDSDRHVQVDVQSAYNIDVPLSSRASESTLYGIKTGTDYLDDIYGRLDVPLSSRASEATLSSIKNALASVGTDKMRTTIVDPLPAGTNKIGSVDVVSIPNPSNLDIALSSVRDLFRPILKGGIFNTSITANTNIFAQDLSPSNPPTAFRIYACLSSSGILTVRRTKAGTTISEQLNSGLSLNGNCAYIFDIMVDQGETINLWYSVNATALKISVYEIQSVIC